MDSNTLTANSDFSCTHSFCSGVLLTTVYIGNYKSIDFQKRTVVFEKGKENGKDVQRLAIYNNRASTFFGANRHQNVRHRNQRPCFLVSLDENDFHGLIKGVQSRRVRYGFGKYVFSPTITIVTKTATVILMTTEVNYERSLTQHDLWYNCLKRKLHFGGYWNVDHETSAGNSSTVTLCVSKHRLSLLVVSPDDQNIFSIQAKYRTSSIVCWKLHFVDRQRYHVAYLSVTVAPDDDPANFERLRFRIEHNETVASDISEVLSLMHLPRIQFEVRHQMTPPHLDLEVYQSADVADQLTPALRRRNGTCRPPNSNRRSRDDMDVFLQRLPPPHLPPRQRPHQRVLNSYDLNALSCTESVQDAVHFYQNTGSVSRLQRPRRPPDVVISHLDEDEEYWSIVLTLDEVLRKKKPVPDTLRLTFRQRLTLCFLLLDDSIASWKNLAEQIGLKQEAVTMIETLFRNSYVDDVTPTECVLRHWQFVYNKSLASAAPPSPTTSSSNPPPCTLESLINILKEIGRHDLVVKLSPPGDSSAA